MDLVQFDRNQVNKNETGRANKTQEINSFDDETDKNKVFESMKVGNESGKGTERRETRGFQQCQFKDTILKEIEQKYERPISLNVTCLNKEKKRKLYFLKNNFMQVEDIEKLGII